MRIDVDWPNRELFTELLTYHHSLAPLATAPKPCCDARNVALLELRFTFAMGIAGGSRPPDRKHLGGQSASGRTFAFDHNTVIANDAEDQSVLALIITSV